MLLTSKSLFEGSPLFFTCSFSIEAIISICSVGVKGRLIGRSGIEYLFLKRKETKMCFEQLSYL